jgi:hypothetical protein
MATEMNEETPGSELFAPLTCDEMSVLQAHLFSGMSKQGYVTHDSQMHSETAATCHDIHVAWNLRWDAEHPGAGQ